MSLNRVNTHVRTQEQHIYAMCEETMTSLVMVSITNILATTITENMALV